MREYLNALNPKQREAVEYCDGPELVLAGAGSGKTRVLTSKIAYLISEKDVPPRRILALTFTNKAAREMRDRVEEMIGGDFKGMEVSTFHAYGLRFLFRYRDALSALGYPPSFAVFDREDSKGVIKNAIKELDENPGMWDVRDTLDRISKAKTEANPVTREPALKGRMLHMYEAYNKALVSLGALDFDDLLVLPLHILATNREVLKRERERIEWVLVDEYQDINRPQYLLLRCLVDDSRKIMVVGDPDQSIYGWRGADMSMILNFEKDFRGAEVITLSQNYRSTSNILNGANAVIKNNRDRYPKDLWTDSVEGAKIEIYRTRSDTDEASWVCEKIDSLRDMGYSYGEMAILYRMSALGRGVESALFENGLPYRVVRGMPFYSKLEVKDVISMLRLAVNPRDTVALERIANVPRRGLGKKSLEKLSELLEALEGEPAEVWDEIERTAGGLKGRSADGAVELAGNMKALLGFSDDAGAAVRFILNEQGYEDYLRNEYPDDCEDRVDNVRELLSVMKGDKKELALFLTEIILQTDQDVQDDTADAVNLLTLHAAKGLEFPVVFMVGMDDGIFPDARATRIYGDGDLSEERRLCYVGMTRARERLFMSSASRRMLFGGVQMNKQSRFVSEVPESCANIENNTKGGGFFAYGRSDRRRWRR